MVIMFRLSLVGSFSLRSAFSSAPRLQRGNYPTTFDRPERGFHSTCLNSKPKRGTIVDTYRTVSVNCSKCRQRLFRYKKKNGTKSNLVKCYVERIAEDSAGVLERARCEMSADALPHELPPDHVWECPSCKSQFARSAQIHGLPALKLVGGKVTMTKK